MEGESKKRTCRRVNTAPTTAIPCQAPEGAKQLQAKPSQVLMKCLLEIFFFFKFISELVICIMKLKLKGTFWVFSNSNSCSC